MRCPKCKDGPIIETKELRYNVTFAVFTCATCGYRTNSHQEIWEYNLRGKEVTDGSPSRM